MSTYLGLFYAKRLGNRIHCIFVFYLFIRVRVSHTYLFHKAFQLTIDINGMSTHQGLFYS